MFTGDCSAREMLNLIDHLPSDSAYAEASAQDDELAEMMADLEDDGKPYRPRITEYGPDVQRLDAIFDRLGELIAATYAAAGGKPQTVKPAPRPETARDRIDRKRVDAEFDALVAEIEAAKG